MERDSQLPVPVQTLLGDRYRLEKVLSSGGFGTVYEAVQVDLGRRVAVKVLREAARLAPDALARFEREAKATGSLGHTHIVQVTDFSAGPPPFLVMELLSGAPLATALADAERLPVGRALRIALQVLSALGAAHALGIVHRDIKPANLFLVSTATGEDLVKVLDFGIAKATLADDGARTESGVVLGTVRYMAPEQAIGAPVDARADLYAVGAVLYRMLSGANVVEARSVAELLHELARGPIPLEQRMPELPGAIADVVMRALTPDPAGRFESAAAMALALSKAGDVSAPAWAERAAPNERSASTTAPTRRDGADGSPSTRTKPTEGTFEPHAKATETVRAGAAKGGMIGAGILGAAAILALTILYVTSKRSETPVTVASNAPFAPSGAASDAPPPRTAETPTASISTSNDAAAPAARSKTFVDDRGAEYTPIPTVRDPAGRSWWAIGPMWFWPTSTPPQPKSLHASQVDTCDSTCPDLVAADAVLRTCAPLAQSTPCLRVRNYYFTLQWRGGQLARQYGECESVDESQPTRPRMVFVKEPAEPRLDACLVGALRPVVEKYLTRATDSPTSVFVQIDR